ncbi:hypothetical protein [Aliiroseovarius sp. YM-037]|uniref:hypothetical protein n=1 Tax=Aliiroseovarius sp. YM-037 TaxID=3341728 RepID=UPI003A80742D
MYNSIENTMVNAYRRQKARRKHQEITRGLDAIALTELGYPPKRVDPKQRRWFLYL